PQASAWPEQRGRSAWPSPPPPPAHMTYEPPRAPYASTPRPRRPDIPPVIVAATILGWLTVLALVLALALGAD
ncbi:MAG: hypothetical protein M3389_13705, partial [Actinomycetota bacterium]|nr:hypothetical protein [Actinomycetota bacterium]